MMFLTIEKSPVLGGGARLPSRPSRTGDFSFTPASANGRRVPLMSLGIRVRVPSLAPICTVAYPPVRGVIPASMLPRGFAFNAGANSQPVPVVGGVHPGGNQSEIVRIFRASSVVKLAPILGAGRDEAEVQGGAHTLAAGKYLHSLREFDLCPLSRRKTEFFIRGGTNSANQNKAWSGKLMPGRGCPRRVNAEQCRRVRLRENCSHGLSRPARAIRPLTLAERPGEITGATPQGAQRGKNGRKKPEHVHAFAGVGLQASIRRGPISHDTR